MPSNVMPMEDHDPDCLHCAMTVTAAQFANSHPNKSNEHMTAEMLQFAAQFVVFATKLSPEDAVTKLTAEMRRAAAIWLMSADEPKS